MGIQFCSLASGSKGNSYIIGTNETAILVDVGVSGKRIFQSLDNLGLGLEKVNGVLITHEHTDHMKSVRIVMKKMINANLFSNMGTWEKLNHLVEDDRQITFKTGNRFNIGNISVKSFLVYHDAAEPVGFSFTHTNKKVSIITDTGIITEEIYDEIKDSDLLVIESNHDPNLVLYCKYPYSIKRRILGDNGHLSNETTGKWICKMLKEIPKPRRIMFAHLSGENNSRRIVLDSIENIMEEEGLLPLKETELYVLSQTEMGEVFKV